MACTKPKRPLLRATPAAACLLWRKRSVRPLQPVSRPGRKGWIRKGRADAGSCADEPCAAGKRWLQPSPRRGRRRSSPRRGTGRGPRASPGRGAPRPRGRRGGGRPRARRPRGRGPVAGRLACWPPRWPPENPRRVLAQRPRPAGCGRSLQCARRVSSPLRRSVPAWAGQGEAWNTPTLLDALRSRLLVDPASIPRNLGLLCNHLGWQEWCPLAAGK